MNPPPTKLIESGVAWSDVNGEVLLFWVGGISVNFNPEDPTPEDTVHVCTILNSSTVCFRARKDLKPLVTQQDWMEYKKAEAFCRHRQSMELMHQAAEDCRKWNS